MKRMKTISIAIVAGVLPLLWGCGDFSAQGGLLSILLLGSPETTASAPGNTEPVTAWTDPEGGSCYTYRRKVLFDSSHDAVFAGHTVSFSMDTTASGGVANALGQDVRILWHPAAGSAIELDRLGNYDGSTWNSTSTTVHFRLQSDLAAGETADPDGEYYVYYGCASPSTPPEAEANVFYFADFFNRGALLDGASWNTWQIWDTGGSVAQDVEISSSALLFQFQSDPHLLGAYATFDPLPGDFLVSMDFTTTIPFGAEGTHVMSLMQIGENLAAPAGDYSTGVGPSLFLCETHGSCPVATENNLVSNIDTASTLKTGTTPITTHSLDFTITRDDRKYKLFVDATGPPSNNVPFVDSSVDPGSLNTIRMGGDNINGYDYTIDNLVISLSVASPPVLSLDDVETSGG